MADATTTELGLPSAEVSGYREFGDAFHLAMADARTWMVRAVERGFEPVTHEWKKGHTPFDALPIIVLDTLRRAKGLGTTWAHMPFHEEVPGERWRKKATARDCMGLILLDMMEAQEQAYREGKGLTFIGGEALRLVYSDAVLERALDRIELLQEHGVASMPGGPEYVAGDTWNTRDDFGEGKLSA